MSGEASVADLAAVWESMASLGDTLDEREWVTPTECPGWTVQDNVAHIIGIESMILGRPNPPHEPVGGPHVHNEIGAANEVWVDFYRSRLGADVLVEFRAITGERLAILRDPALDLGSETWTPVGPGTVRDLVRLRIFDSWVHEQDMRRALGRPGDLDSPAAATCLDQIEAVMPMIVGKRVAPPDGTVVAFTVAGPAGPVGRAFAIRVENRRAAFLDSVPADVDAHLELDAESFVRLGTGRGDPESILAGGSVTLLGDPVLGRRVAEHMNFLF